MEKEMLEEIMKECNWKERLLVKILAKTFLKVYHIGRLNAVNAVLKK